MRSPTLFALLATASLGAGLGSGLVDPALARAGLPPARIPELGPAGPAGPNGADPAQATLPFRSVHEEALRRHPGSIPPGRRMPTPDQLKHGSTRSLARVVYGYYPYWLQDLSAIRWSALTHLAWFAIELDSSGQATATHGWPDAAAVQAAHDAGVQVHLCFTLFSGSGIQALTEDPARRAAAIATMIDQMEAGDADGISVDFEGLLGSSRDTFTTFIQELRATLDSRGHPMAEISIAGPAVDWTSAFDMPALLAEIDYYFIMGYGFFWSGSSYAGPTGLLRVTSEVRHAVSWSALRSIATYSKRITAAERRQIVYGVPYYGREWTTADDTFAAAALASQGAVPYADAQDAVETTQTRRWNGPTRTPWYAWQVGGTWHEVYYDDVESLTAKYQLILDEDLGGVGIWALNYDAPRTELWDLLETMFGADPAPPPGTRANPIAIDAFPFHDERDTTVGPSQYFNFYGCDDTLAEYGREWIYGVDVCQPGVLAAHVPAYPNDDPDPDLHLLSAPNQDACIDRAHTDLSVSIQPGGYLLTVDTYVANAIEMEGAFALDVTFTPEEGSTPCAPHLSCEQGTCVCPDPALSDCSTLCADLLLDDAHCGSCDNACDPAAHCRDGRCVDDAPPDAGITPDASADATDLPCTDCPRKGCGCDTSAPGAPLPLALLSLLGLALWRRRRTHRQRGSLRP